MHAVPSPAVGRAGNSTISANKARRKQSCMHIHPTFLASTSFLSTSHAQCPTCRLLHIGSKAQTRPISWGNHSQQFPLPPFTLCTEAVTQPPKSTPQPSSQPYSSRHKPSTSSPPAPPSPSPPVPSTPHPAPAHPGTRPPRPARPPPRPASSGPIPSAR
ncbi:hypothetical protein BDR22DRAFT_414834 [Usnea florida]